MVRSNMSRLSTGDLFPTARLDAEQIRFRFPGSSSWAADTVGKDAHVAWLQRFVDAGIQIEADEVVVSGPPWRMTVCVRGRSYLRGPAGEAVYDNRYVLWGTIAWARLRNYEVYEDTEASLRLDDYLATP
jgi:hypothetical protein